MGQKNVHLTLVETKGEYCRWGEGQMESNVTFLNRSMKIAQFWKLLRNIRLGFGQKQGVLVNILGCRLFFVIFKLFHFEHV